MNFILLLVLSSACIITCGHMDYYETLVPVVDKSNAHFDYRKLWDFASARDSSHIIEITGAQQKNTTSKNTQQ